MTGEPVESAEVRDLRDLLAAVLDAVTLDRDVDDYDERVADRAAVVKVVLRDILDKGDEVDWNADWLRQKLREEEARHGDGLPEPLQESDLDRQPHPGRGTTGRSGFGDGERS